MSSPYERFARGARRDYRSEERRNNIVFAGYTVGVILLTGLAIRYVDKRKIWKLIEMYSAEIERLTKAIDE